MKNLFLPLIFCIGFLISQGESAEHQWKNYINRQRISCLFADDEYLWIGTDDAGLVRRNCTTGQETVFDKDEGFFSDRIIGVVRDSNKVMWAASPKNIACLKNDSWVVENLFGDSVKDMTVDSSGTVWVACSNGIGRRIGNQFVKISAFDSLKKAQEYPIAIVSGSGNNIIYVLVQNRVFCFTIDGMHCQTIDIPFNIPMGICVDTKNRLFVAGSDTVGLYQNDQWRFFSRSDSSLLTTVTQLSVSPHGDVWAYGGGDIFVFNNDKWELRHKHTYGSGIVSTVAPLTKGSAWFGKAFFLALKTPDTLAVVPSGTPGGNDIKFVFADREGTIWTQAANDIGIMRLIDEKWVFKGPFNPLYNKTIKMIHTADSVYWFLQPRNCLNYLLKINGGVELYTTGAAFVPSGSSNDFIEDAAGAIWFATSNGVVSNRSQILYNKENAGFASNTINALLLRKDSTVWAGGNDGTLAYFKDGTWTLQTISIKSHITCLAEDSSGNLWIGTSNGIINKNHGTESIYTVLNGLGSNIITDIFVDRDNNVWVGTYNGLTCFENGVLKKTYLRPCGIAGNSITSICQNKDGVLWIGTDRGISALTIGVSAVKKRIPFRHPAPEAGAHAIITLGTSSKARQEPAGAVLLNGKKGTLPFKNKSSRSINCYIVTN